MHLAACTSSSHGSPGRLQAVIGCAACVAASQQLWKPSCSGAAATQTTHAASTHDKPDSKAVLKCLLYADLRGPSPVVQHGRITPDGPHTETLNPAWQC